MSRKIPAKRKKNAKEALRERVGINDGYTFGGNFVNFTTSFLTVGITLFTPIYNLQDLIPQTQETAAVLSGLTRGGGTGGPDYTVLDGDFLHTSSKSDICDSDNWRLAPGASSALVTYASSSPTGSSYQLEFIPTGTKSANITFGRFDAYEITFGEDSFRHLSLKNLQTKKLVTLFSLSQTPDDEGSRIDMGVTLSTSTSNTVRIDEKVTSESRYHLEITVNGKHFTSKEITLLNQSKYQSLYLGLIDRSHDKSNKTGLVSPLLSICK